MGARRDPVANGKAGTAEEFVGDLADLLGRYRSTPKSWVGLRSGSARFR
jgi:hypothetical protein